MASRVLAAAVAILAAAPASAQSLARASFDSVVAVDVMRGQNAADRPNIVVDVTGVVRLGKGWLVYVRPWFRQPRDSSWDKEIYQAALQHERRGRISTRFDLGYIVSPIGLGMMDTRPGVNPLIMPHLAYLVAMPLFDPTAPRVEPIAASYPFGGQLTASTTTWDARVAVIHTAPTRSYVLNGGSNPDASPAFVAGAGVTPHIGLRIGASVARGTYATRDELTVPDTGGRSVTMMAVETEYAFGYTKLSAEFVRDRFETLAGSEAAYAWFVQGVHTLAPRVFVAARQEGASAPPLRSGIVPGKRAAMHVTETTMGYRLSRDFTLRGSFIARKAYTRPEWDQQGGVSLVWSHRWW